MLLLVLVVGSRGGRVLVVPGEYSHWHNMRVIVEELVERNHSVRLLRMSSSPSIQPDEPFDFMSFDVPMKGHEVHAISEEMIRLWMDEAHTSSRLEMARKIFDLTSRIQHFQIVGCNAMLGNKELLATLKAERFDVLLFDPMLPCVDLLAEIIQVPFVISIRLFLGYSLERMCGQMPAPPSYVPISPVQLTDHMNFTQRLYNFLLYCFYTVAFQVFTMGSINQYYSQVLGK